MTRQEHSKYLIVSDIDKHWGLTVSSVGTQTIKPNTPYPPTNHPPRYLFSPVRGRILNEFQLLYLSDGEGVFETKSYRKKEIKTGNFFLLFKGEWHNYKPDKKKGWTEYWIGFDGSNIESRIKHNLFSSKNPVLYVGLRDSIVQLYEQAINLALEQAPGFQPMLAGIVEQLLSMAFSYNIHQELRDEKLEQINKAKIVIFESFQQYVDIEGIAQQVNMSYSTFRQSFKKYTGFSPNQYVIELRIQKSKELLTNTNHNSQEISFLTGFDNPVHFCTVFKQKTGFTPLAYRAFTQGKYISK